MVVVIMGDEVMKNEYDQVSLDQPGETEPEPGQEAIDRAGAVLSRVGMRLMELEGGTTVGLWSDLDAPEIRAALRVFGSHLLPLRYLDGPGIPARYQLRRVAGEPVPESVRVEMERHPAEPWKIRDQMLSGMGGPPKERKWRGTL
jgi:hypothetical protein